MVKSTKSSAATLRRNCCSRPPLVPALHWIRMLRLLANVSMVQFFTGSGKPRNEELWLSASSLATSYFTARVNVEHTRLVLPAYLIAGLAIYGSKVFVGLHSKEKVTIWYHQVPHAWRTTSRNQIPPPKGSLLLSSRSRISAKCKQKEVLCWLFIPSNDYFVTTTCKENSVSFSCWYHCHGTGRALLCSLSLEFN